MLKLDLFPSEFFFTLSDQIYQKKTFSGMILTLFVVFTLLFYFLYLLSQYVNNQIDPKFRSQTFIVNHKQQIEFSNDLVGFAFQYNSSMTIDEYQAKQNLTYLVYYPQYYYADNINNITLLIDLDVIPCTDSSLSGLNCIDFSKISNQTLVLDIGNKIYSSLQINVYGCLDLDTVKTTIPSNCAQQTDIDNIINGIDAQFYLKMKTQQYNTTSKQIQTNYRNIYSYVLSSQMIINTLKTQTQETSVSQGLIFQQSQIYSSPYQYSQLIQSFDRQQSLLAGLGPYIQENILMDELLQQFQIQYPTITEILALVNSIAFIVMFSRMAGRFFSKRLIQEDIFMLIFRNLFQENNYQILKHNKLIEQQIDLNIQSSNDRNEIDNDQIEQEIPTNKKIPAFETKFRDYVEKQQVQMSYSDKEAINYQTFFTQEEDIKEQQSDEARNLNRTNLGILNTMSRKLISIQNGQSFNKRAQLKTQNSLLFKQTTQKRISIFQNRCSSQSEQISVRTPCNIQNTLNLSYELQKEKPPQNKQILKDIISSKLKALHSNKMKHAIHNLIFKFKAFKSKAFLLYKGIDHKQIMHIDQEAKRSQNIYHLYEDIIFLKKAISMLLSQEQLAAIKLVSLTDNYFNLDLKSEQITNQYKSMQNKLNHFEKQYVLFQSEKLQAEYIVQFFMNHQTQRTKNEIEQRIISSIIKNK
ncbi:AMP-binding enzyme family protein (macronuclear) [Tetrahymena thermophila SB210]|uniref:AMP-binding enzyme family protein n=1 Tax=Tetrahymena thermophila (strain SB210) TaxID=312017 RepID=Q22B01_TETTS|nr:AMP-binding enzyme family protein [Tetrahymena thermophila SB210]EAR82457.2 AMP-binding enzyme family protein [Tetrahymena thermophila SB210]|eukprot:XP_001030120.2 AMP-binding enzyme family protein [Tetrahymena thermophila SB210]